MGSVPSPAPFGVRTRRVIAVVGAVLVAGGAVLLPASGDERWPRTPDRAFGFGWFVTAVGLLLAGVVLRSRRRR